MSQMTIIIEALPLLVVGYFTIGLFVFLWLIDYKDKNIYQKIGISFLWGVYFIGILIISLFVGICDFGNFAISYVVNLFHTKTDNEEQDWRRNLEPHNKDTR